ncbi:MAG: response regulator, partial [Algicola sp.]|nr:response regulator [Algicola sp.]
GSTFSFTLPVADEKPAPDSAGAQAVARLHVLAQDSDNTPEYPPNINSNINPNGQRFRLLLVDDEPINRQVLHNHLSLQNYELVEAEGGEQALTIIDQSEPFDLILLDIMMPKVSGYQVCKTLRERYSANDLPVIFLTAKNQVADLVQSFAVGANDYLTKPVSKHELLTRVETHLKFLAIHRDLEGQVRAKTTQLVQAEKMSSLGTLTAGVAHEINNPTNFVHISTHNLKVDLDSFQQFLFDLAGEDAQDGILDSFRQRFTPLYQHLATIQDGTQRIKTIVRDLKVFTGLDQADEKTVVITELLQSTVNLVQTQYKKTIEFVIDFAATPQLQCFPAQLNQVFMNLIVNACDAIKTKQQTSEGKGHITITCGLRGDTIEITVKDNGCGMIDETKRKLFEPFYTTKDVGEGTGLGLSIAFGIVQKHGGELVVESELGVGSTFVISLPGAAG